MVAQQLLVLFVKVRVLAGLPLHLNEIFIFEIKFSVVIFRLIKHKLTQLCLTTLRNCKEYGCEKAV